VEKSVFRRALLAEDDPIVNLATQCHLEEMGFDVIAAFTAAEALHRTAGDHAFDLLVTDIQMPGEIDGWGLAERLRVAIPNIAVVYASGYSDGVRRDVARSAFLPKPYTQAALKAAITAVFGEL
jgi:CheY-like chemotaxis protein